MNSNKLTYSKTIETEPEYAELLNYLVDRIVIPAMQKRISQGAGSKKLTAEEELQAILSFGSSERVGIPRQKSKSIVQGGLNSTELENLYKILQFGQRPNTRKTEKEE